MSACTLSLRPVAIRPARPRHHHAALCVQALELEIARANNTATLAERTFRAAQNERGKEINGLSEELISVQNSLEAQQAQLANFEAKVQSGQLDSDNRMHTMESLKAKVLSL